MDGCSDGWSVNVHMLTCRYVYVFYTCTYVCRCVYTCLSTSVCVCVHRYVYMLC